MNARKLYCEKRRTGQLFEEKQRTALAATDANKSRLFKLFHEIEIAAQG
ncbi:hypothetical protein [Paenibacillus elgii]|nr:hypothetical protein [Paenibacillus elgii]